MSVEIWHIEGRRSLRVVWACEELDLPYALHFQKGDIFGSLLAIREVYPMMPVTPAVKLDGTWIVESGGIIDVLLARYGHGKLVPEASTTDFIHHAQWMHFAEGSALARMLGERFVSIAAAIPMDQMVEGYRAPGKAQQATADGKGGPLGFVVGSRGVFDYMDAHLAEHPYFGGTNFSAADIMMHWPVQVAGLMSWIDLADYPAVARWREVVEQRPAYRRAIDAAIPDGADLYGQPPGIPYPFEARPA